MKKSIVIINEAHTLLPAQQKILDEKYQHVDFYRVPNSGLTAEEQKKVGWELQDHFRDIVFVSPVPILLASCAKRDGYEQGKFDCNQSSSSISRVFVFHNSFREKKEASGGRIISVVAKEGWELIEIKV